MDYNKKTSCPKAGIKIHETPNNLNILSNPYAPYENIDKSINLLNLKKINLDFNLENYTLEGLYKLFNIDSKNGLDEIIMKNARNFTLKTHPDKSKLDSKYYIFYSKAFNKLNEIYQYQNKSSNKKSSYNNYENVFSEYDNEDKKNLMDKFIENNKNLSKSENFNEWFNEQFEKYDLQHKRDDGYDDWFKSNENIYESNEKVTLENFNDKFNKHKKDMLALSVYKSQFEDQYSTNDSFQGTDLKNAYAQTIIPVSEDDFNKVNKYKNVNEYKNARETQDIKPLDSTESEKILYGQKLKDEETSAAQAYEYALQLEKNKKQNEGFWSSLKFLANF